MEREKIFDMMCDIKYYVFRIDGALRENKNSESMALTVEEIWLIDRLLEHVEELRKYYHGEFNLRQEQK